MNDILLNAKLGELKVSIEIGPNLERLLHELFGPKEQAPNNIEQPLNGPQRANLSNRIGVESLNILKDAFVSKSYISNKELAAHAHVDRKTVNALRLVQRDRPDLLEHIFADRLSIAAANEHRKSGGKEQPVLTPSRI